MTTQKPRETASRRRTFFSFRGYQDVRSLNDATLKDLGLDSETVRRAPGVLHPMNWY